MAQAVWKWDSFYGGESDYRRMITDTDKTKFQTGSYCIDYRSEPDGIKLLSSKTEYGSYDSIPTAMLNLAEYGLNGIIVCTGGNKKVYLDGTLKRTFTGTGDVTSIFVMNVGGTNYVYFVATNRIHRATTDLNTWVEDKVIYYGGSDKKFVLPLPNGFYVSGGNEKVFFFDRNEVMTELVALPNSGYVVWMTKFQDLVKIYWRQDGSANSEIYVWDGISSQIQYSVPYYNLPILGASNIGERDVIVTGYNKFYSDVYEVAGTSKQLTVSNYEGNANKRQFTGVCVSRNDDVFLASPNGIYRYGQYYAGFPKSIARDFLLDSDDIGFLYVYGNTLYVGMRKSLVGSKVYSYDLNTPPNAYDTVGEIISMNFDGGDATKSKKLVAFRIEMDSDASHPDFPRGGNVTLYARNKPSAAWTAVSTFASDTSDSLRIDNSQLVWLGLGDFTQLELKIKLERGSSTKSPFIKGVYVIYDETQIK